MNKVPSESFPIEIDVDGTPYTGEVIALANPAKRNKVQNQYSVLLNQKIYFHIEFLPEGWRMPECEIVPQRLADAVGNFIHEYYG